MKKPIYSIITIMMLVSCTGNNSDQYILPDNPLFTEWALQVNPEKPWNIYPRPGMKRKEWMNLNGLWDYSVTPADSGQPEEWEGKILVPFPVESALSGLKRRISEDEKIWYRTTVTIPSKWGKRNLLLNFEAADWETTVWVNGTLIGTHRGGYDPFSFEITEAAGKQRNIGLVVSVWDPTNRGTQPRGKQVTNPGGIWYTPSSGIWQTVWIEPVNNAHIESFRVYTSVEESTIRVEPKLVNAEDAAFRLTVSSRGKILGSAENNGGEGLTIKVEDAVLWTPDNPFLYDLNLELLKGGKIVDAVTSVAGIRKISLGRTGDGFTRILLNNEFLFQNGPLDQGFWPDGLYTPPTEEAMIYDLWMLKKMGFNMLRKHVKVENRIFYNWCDRIGLLVWQDMPNGDRHISGNMPDIQKDPEADRQFRFELQRMIETKFNHPSIVMWVPFNEGWGQYDTEGITAFIKEIDPTRLVNSASGWTDRGTGDILDIHNYPDPRAPAPEEHRATVLGEFGGLGLPVANHTWEERNWGYRNMMDVSELLEKYEQYYEEVHKFVTVNGLSAAVYTQTTDVETETNGLMTYDRKIDKIGTDNISKAHAGITPPYKVNNESVFIDTFRLVLGCHDTTAIIRFTTNGQEPTASSDIFSEPVVLTETTTIMSKAWYGNGVSRTVTFVIEKTLPMEPVETDTSLLKPGLSVKLYEGNFDLLPDFSTLVPVKEFKTTSVSHTLSGLNSHFAMLFEGFIVVPADGVYGFFITSDDGSKLFIDDELVADNDGIHGMEEKSAWLALGKGAHKIGIGYFQRTGGIGLTLYTGSPSGEKRIIEPHWLFSN